MKPNPRPLIGVTASRKGGRFMWWFNRFSVWRNGGRAVRILPGEDIRVRNLDGLIIGGGDDIAPTLYGAELDPAVRFDPERDALEKNLVERAVRRGIPTLGICRGAQMINVSLGGSLHKDIYEIFENASRVRTPLPVKDVTIEADTRLADIIQTLTCRVNAIHHQSVSGLGEGLSAVAHDRQGIIQAVEANTGPFLIGVQWHPEFLVFDRGQQNLYRALIEAARSSRHQSVPASSD